MKKLAVFLTVTVLVLMAFASVPTQSQRQNDKLHKKANKIANSYIVVLDDSVVGERGEYSIAPYIADEIAASHGGKIKHVYKHALNGFAIEMSEADAEAVSQDFRVKYVEEDGVMTADVTQSNPPWGSGPHRPAQSAAQRHLRLQLDGIGCACLRDRHGYSHRTHTVWRACFECV